MFRTCSMNELILEVFGDLKIFIASSNALPNLIREDTGYQISFRPALVTAESGEGWSTPDGHSRSHAGIWAVGRDLAGCGAGPVTARPASQRSR